MRLAVVFRKLCVSKFPPRRLNALSAAGHLITWDQLRTDLGGVTMMIQLWTGVSVGVAAAVVTAAGISYPALPGFSQHSDWLRFQFTKKRTQLHTISMHMRLSALRSWSDLHLRLLVLSSSCFFQVDVSLTKGKYS